MNRRKFLQTSGKVVEGLTLERVLKGAVFTTLALKTLTNLTGCGLKLIEVREGTDAETYAIPFVCNFIEDKNNNRKSDYPEEYEGLRKEKDKEFRTNEEITYGIRTKNMIGAKVSYILYRGTTDVYTKTPQKINESPSVISKSFGPGDFYEKYGRGRFTLVYYIDNSRVGDISFSVV